MNNGTLLFTNCTLEGICVINVAGTIKFTLSDKVKFNKIKVSGSLHSLECRDLTSINKIDGEFIMDGRITEINLSNSTFVNASFSGVLFENRVEFRNVTFFNFGPDGKTNFEKALFAQAVVFENVNFGKSCSFRKCTFNDTASFIAANASTECKGDFSLVKLKKRVFFNHSRFAHLKFDDTEFSEIVSFKDLKVDELPMSKTLFFRGQVF